ncbi:MAG TPA: sodium:proton antiporter [Ignavibacteriaceae bacterium]|nr:sodium:proton antiporter [Ignavibacteriaceae bacterium]
MNHLILIGLAAIITIGILAQWVAWKFKLPSILLLLTFGIIAGPVTGLLQPDEFFGNLLFPVVSISVAIILFEGGLSLKFSELKTIGKIVRNLILVAIPVTWILISSAAYFILGLEFSYSVLLGAILVVTGPTVILPLLRQVRPKSNINSILKWEGIVNDPIGALIAILVFEALISTGFGAATLQTITGLLKIILISSSIGLLGSYLIVVLLKHRIIPDFLQNPFSLTMVIAIFTLSNIVQAESGLLAVTVMGIYLANQKQVNVKHIVEFKENLRLLLLSFLFIILAARLTISDIEMLSVSSFVFVAALIFLVRPAAVFLSTIKSKLNWKERVFLSFMAPRGVVAAAVSSIFALELSRLGYKSAEILVPITFLVIILTITVYSLSAMPLAKWFGIAEPNPQGCLIIGGHPFARAIGKMLKEKGFRCVLVDTNRVNLSLARMEGLPVYYGSVISDYIMNEIELAGIGRLLALTPNPEVNSLAALHFSKIFGRTEVYQLSTGMDENTENDELSHELKGHTLFNKNINFEFITKIFNRELIVKSTNITEKFTYEIFLRKYDKEKVVPLFLITENTELNVLTSDSKPKPGDGDTLISLVPKEKEE